MESMHISLLHAHGAKQHREDSSHILVFIIMVAKHALGIFGKGQQATESIAAPIAL